jgi:DNA polymerase-1
MRYTIGCELGTKSTVEDCLEYFQFTPHVEVDTETSGLDPHKDKIVSLQLGDHANQWFIDTRHVDILLFKQLLESKLCILHNAKFDYKMLRKAGIVLEQIYDTMLAECVLACGHDKWGYTLKALYKRYLGIELAKEEQKSFIGLKNQEFTLAQIEYACEDVSNLGNIRAHQMMKLQKFDLKYCANLENEVVKALGDIEYNGMYLDSDAWIKMTNAHKAKLFIIQQNLDKLVMEDPKLVKFRPQGQQANLFGDYERPTSINFGSPKQVLEICHILGEPVETTNEREIGKLAKLDAETSEVIFSKHPFFGLLLQNREAAKIVSTYGLSFLDYINPVTGRIHTNFWQVLNTGRVSSGDPNLQNLPAKNLFRNCFKARPGFKWVSIDYSGQELRIMADGSGEQGFIDVLNSGQDLHCYAGEMMFKRPIDKKKDKALRDKAKTINFGRQKFTIFVS